jgi:hypothetical protein
MYDPDYTDTERIDEMNTAEDYNRFEENQLAIDRDLGEGREYEDLELPLEVSRFEEHVLHALEALSVDLNNLADRVDQLEDQLEEHNTWDQVERERGIFERIRAAAPRLRRI